jgi:hypothetical protein
MTVRAIQIRGFLIGALVKKIAFIHKWALGFRLSAFGLLSFRIRFATRTKA